MKKNPLFSGTGTALVTPFKKDGSVDEICLTELVDFQLSGKVEALVPVGSTGEGATLGEEEQAMVIATVVERVGGKVPVIAGASSNSTMKAVDLAIAARNAGAAAILSVAPYYNKPTQEGIYQHFSMIADSSEMPMVIYNVPGRTASNINAETVLRLAEEIPFVIGIKEASADFSQIMEIIRHRRPGFGVWAGDDNLTLPLVSLGADGVISVVANEVPKMFSELVRYALKGKFERARKLHYKLLPLMDLNFIESNPIPV
ncbi:MAG: 4-hydroxy-tetrahydrodipicolinate synthase, partial [Ignavibacteria bacterium]|nr:4-hydroxy-tetrahydrodipicolinate synthase [Ignavibacteria bacterium]